MNIHEGTFLDVSLDVGVMLLSISCFTFTVPRILDRAWSRSKLVVMVFCTDFKKY